VSQEWYYAQGGVQKGPVTIEEMKSLLGSGQLRSSDLVWHDGMDQWTQAANIEGLVRKQFSVVLAPSAPPSTSPDWHYVEAGQQKGPVTVDRLQALVASGQLQANTLVWHDGLSGWVQAHAVQGFFPSHTSGTQTTPFGPPPLDRIAAQVAPAGFGGGRMAVLVLTIIAGFFSFFIGISTASMIAALDKGVPNAIGMFALLGFFQAVLGITGGIYAFQKYNSPSEVTIAGPRFKQLTLAAVMILLASALSIHHCVGFITAGLMNGIAGTIALMRAHSLGSLNR
jgi:hypothetical protein